MPKTSARLNNLEREPAVSAREVINALRENIRVGRLVPGQRLVEADIVKETGASRSKVREALQRLETEGLVAIEEFRGATVRQLSMDEVRQIYHTRMALEGMVAAEFAQSDKKPLKKRLRQLQSSMNALKGTGDHRRFAQLNDAWHRLIMEGSGNRYAAQFLSQLSTPIYRLLFTSFYSAQRIDRANADHKIITAAIIQGKAELAEKAMRNHIADGLAAVAELSEKLHP
ncbi:MAG TPA: GntR family transcriptional regulator [Terriglobia bacterium]|nr:GntR family transcriptional regulator [Terriglobia bacterium]